MIKKVGVVILNYKLAELTLRCLKSVLESNYKNIEIVVVDNASGDGIDEKIKEFKDVIFIKSLKNLGYTGGNNLGIKKLLENGADFIFILNPDTTIEKNTIQELISFAEKNNSDITGSKIYFDYQEEKAIWFAGGIFNRFNVLGSHKGVNQKDQGQYDQAEETDFVTGAAMFVRRFVFEKIGFFDEQYFLYLEDLDFCYRAKNSGFKIMYCPKAKVFHENAKSTGLGSTLQDYYITRNRMLFAKKFLSFRTQLALFREVLRNFSNGVRRKALFDFLTGSFGKGNI